MLWPLSCFPTRRPPLLDVMLDVGPTGGCIISNGVGGGVSFYPRMSAETFRSWPELDHLLAQFRESHSIHAEILYDVPFSMNEEEARSFVEGLSPELARRGLVSPRLTCGTDS